MGKQERLAKLIRQVRESGVDLRDFTVVAEGVFFASHQPAVKFAKKHGKDLKRVSAQVSGWLARNKPAKRS